jgi:hypothetical protein
MPPHAGQRNRRDQANRRASGASGGSRTGSAGRRVIREGDPGATSRCTVPERRWRIALTLTLAIYGWQCLRSRYLPLARQPRPRDPRDRAPGIRLRRRVPHAAGGTLFQLLVPTVFIVALLRHGDRHGATVPLWWLGQNCWNVSLYIKDARTQELPLVGGGSTIGRSCLGSSLGWTGIKPSAGQSSS